MAMSCHSIVGGLLTGTLATGLLVAGSPHAAAQGTGHNPAQLVAGSTVLKPHTSTARPPILFRPRATCHESSAIVVVKLRNPTKTARFFEIRLSGGEYAEALPVGLPAHGADSVEFSGVSNGTYRVQVLNDLGDLVTQTRFRVRCKVKPPALPPRRVQAQGKS
jgi:hypothetical protein